MTHRAPRSHRPPDITAQMATCWPQTSQDGPVSGPLASASLGGSWGLRVTDLRCPASHPVPFPPCSFQRDTHLDHELTHFPPLPSPQSPEPGLAQGRSSNPSRDGSTTRHHRGRRGQPGALTASALPGHSGCLIPFTEGPPGHQEGCVVTQPPRRVLRDAHHVSTQPFLALLELSHPCDRPRQAPGPPAPQLRTLQAAL